MNKEKVKHLPKEFDIYEFLVNNRFNGDKFLSPDSKNILNFDKTIGYVYYNKNLNTEVILFFNKKKKTTNASIFFKDYDIKFEHLPIKRLVAIIKILNS
ncbi:MAG: hypothetical protein ACPLZ9_07075, partial [Candidatus Ratteibacteria bacterium]